MAFIIQNDILWKYIPDPAETTLTIPGSVKIIAEKAFENCHNLYSVRVEEGLKRIGAYAFQNCGNLLFVRLPESLEKIGAGAFQDCGCLGKINIPDSVTVLHDKVFYNCGLVAVTLPKKMERIGNQAFESCLKLKKIKMPETLQEFGENVFFKCQSLGSVVIPEGITTLKGHLFKNCYNLRFAMISRSVREIVSETFPETTVLHFRIRNALFTIATEQFGSEVEKVSVLKAFCQPEQTEHIQTIMQFLIRHDNAESMTKFLECGFITKETIDGYIRYAIEKQKIRTQVALMEYKDKKIGYQPPDLFL